ncbi:MAG TPA: PEP-CTERM sorting domain-containing protein [Telluria sp.]
MVKKMICGLALMGCALSSQAAEQGFDWSYTGFIPSYSSERQPMPEYGEFNPGHVLKGRFFAEDRNLDGAFSAAEVTSFTVYGESFMNCTGVRECGLQAFSYTPGGALTFDVYDSVEYGSYGSGWSRTSRTYNASNRFYTVYENDWSQSGASAVDYNFTAQTTFAISAVPEPQTWLMLGAGIALLGMVKRRRARNA